MAWNSTLATAQDVKAFVGNPTLADDVLEGIANGADAEIIAYKGSPHPVISHADDTPAVIEVKTREIARRRQAFLTLILETNRWREQGNPLFNGQRMSANDYAARVNAALRMAGGKALWSGQNG